jgi:hypothetical protein
VKSPNNENNEVEVGQFYQIGLSIVRKECLQNQAFLELLKLVY